MALTVNRLPNKFYPDSTRIISRFYMPGAEDRARSIIKRVLDFSDQDVASALSEVLSDFSKRHRNISKVFEKNFDNIKYVLASDPNIPPDTLSLERKLLIGSYFTLEYAIEAAAFLIPRSSKTRTRVISKRGKNASSSVFARSGRGHISSIVFRSGIITQDKKLVFRPAGRFVDLPETVKRHVYEKNIFW